MGGAELQSSATVATLGQWMLQLPVRGGQAPHRHPQPHLHLLLQGPGAQGEVDYKETNFSIIIKKLNQVNYLFDVMLVG